MTTKYRFLTAQRRVRHWGLSTSTSFAFVLLAASCVVDRSPTSPALEAESIEIGVGETAIRGLVAGSLCDVEPVRDDLVVVLLHGASFNSSVWSQTGTLSALCHAGVPTLAIDLPGYGSTPDFDHEPTDVLNMVVAHTNRPVVVVSPSMSGRYSFAWLESDQSSVVGFVPVAPVGVERFNPPDDIDVETLVVWGSDDDVIPVAQSDRLMTLLPDAERSIIKDGGHAVYRTNPDVFNQLLVSFVTQLERET